MKIKYRRGTLSKHNIKIVSEDKVEIYTQNTKVILDSSCFNVSKDNKDKFKEYIINKLEG